VSSGVGRRLGGRPTAQAAALLEASILDHATASFLAEGYAATTIEAIARTCRVAKRTIYARWHGKPALFRAVVDRLMARWLSIAGDWGKEDSLEAALNEAGAQILLVALTPEAVALHRLLIAESARFPELPVMMTEARANEGIFRVAALLDRAIANGEMPPRDTVFAAEQFLHLLLAGPQRRALGLGPSLDEQQIQAWRQNAVKLFMSGVKS
jgi:TetR/AcrR family transcriptional regulator, mexJK operon transcriptional repressor